MGGVFIVKNGYKVAAYLRLSVEDGDKEVSDSIVSQKSIIEEKIKKFFSCVQGHAWSTGE